MKTTQQNKLLSLLQHYHREWVPLPAILQLGIAQYNARIKELRAQGYVIENKTLWLNGIRHSWFRLFNRGEPR